MSKRITALGPWFSALGVVTLLVGLGWDALLHSLDADLAAHEGIFTLTNPGHALLAAGIASSVAGTLLFLLGRARTDRAGSAAALYAYRLGALAILGLAMITFAFAMTDMH